jgi:hypothetical protein
MPAGSGPQVNRTTGASIAAAEVVVATIPPSNWSAGPLGLLISASVNFTPGTAQTTTTLRIRQGTTTGGALVGIAHAVTTVAAAPIELALQEQDVSAFATGGQLGGQYCLTMQTNAAGPGTANAALLELETIAPIQ